MSNMIKHIGVIESINDNLIQVKVTQTSACAGCHIQSMCLSTDQKERIIDVISQGKEPFLIGEKVWVCGKESWGFQAVGWAFFIPFLIILITLILFSHFFSEGVGGVVSLGILLPYYAGLYLFRDRLKKKFMFTIEKI